MFEMATPFAGIETELDRLANRQGKVLQQYVPALFLERNDWVML
jgi:hypothetical protein